jgi:hypothetical protein
VPYGLLVLQRNEIEHVKSQCVVETVKSHQFQTCRIDILNLSGERGDADEIGRSLHQHCEPSFLGVSEPVLERNRRLVGPGIQQQPLGSGRKSVPDGTCGKCGVAPEPDRRGHDVQVAAAGRVGNDKFLSAAEASPSPWPGSAMKTKSASSIEISAATMLLPI